MNNHFTAGRLGVASALAVAVIALVFIYWERETPAADGVVTIKSAPLAPGRSSSGVSLLAGRAGQTGAADPLLAAVMPGASSDIRMMHQQISIQQRDAKAVMAEPTMATTFKSVSVLGARVQSLRVKCVFTFCEIAGTVPAPREEVEAALKTEELGRAWFNLGYSPGPSAAASDNGQTTFVHYVNRKIM